MTVIGNCDVVSYQNVYVIVMVASSLL